MNAKEIYLANLFEKPIWVGHDRQKRPFSAETTRAAKSNDKATWSTHSDAQSFVARTPHLTGVGVQLGPIPMLEEVNLCGIDLDSCFDPDRRIFSASAKEVIERFDTYCEISQSGRGAKILFLADSETLAALPEPSGKTKQYAFRIGKHEELALSCDGRYFAVTGNETGADPVIFDLLGDNTPLRIASLEDLLWFIEIAGPRYKASYEALGSQSSCRDESGSAYAFRFIQRCRREGLDKRQTFAKLEQDDGSAGEWWSRVDNRQQQRAWDRSVVLDPRIERMNEKHAVVMVGGSVRIANLQASNVVTLSTVGDLHALYSNEFIESSQGKLIPTSKAWMASSARLTYSGGIGFYPNGSHSENVLNLWRGFCVQPDANASCDRFLDHIRVVLCGGDQESYDYLIGYFAHLIQHCEDIPGVAVVFEGGKGVGKDSCLDYLAKLVGEQFAPVISQPEQLTGRFNGHLQTALMLRVQEAVWAGSRKDEGALKSLITSPEIIVERKGVDAVTARNHVRVMITANASWVVPASADERRFFVLDIKSKKPDLAYFKALREEMNGSGPAALLHFLQQYDLSQFDVRDVPQTKGLMEQKILSLHNIDRWWFDFLLEATLPVNLLDDFTRDDWKESPITFPRHQLREIYKGWMSEHRFHGEPLGVREFGSRLRALCPIVRDTQPRINGERIRCYVLPTLAACRTEFENWLGAQIDWEEPNA